MPTTDTSEKGLESLIVAALTGEAGYEAGEPQATTATTQSTSQNFSPSCQGTRPEVRLQLRALFRDRTGHFRTVELIGSKSSFSAGLRANRKQIC